MARLDLTGDYYVYITSNPRRTTFYVGVTNDIKRRTVEHFLERGRPDMFAGKYYCYHLLYYETWADPEQAITRETELKGWTRSRKENLIRQENPRLLNLAGRLFDPGEFNELAAAVKVERGWV